MTGRGAASVTRAQHIGARSERIELRGLDHAAPCAAFRAFAVRVQTNKLKIDPHAVTLRIMPHALGKDAERRECACPAEF